MTYILIGSTTGLLGREAKDVDCFTNSPLNVENEDVFWDDRLLEYFDMYEERHASLDELYTIKCSHSYWELPNNSWGKHIADAMRLKSRGATMIDELHDLLYKIWQDKHGSKKVNLVQDSNEFFSDAVTRIYDHDSIHETVSYGEHAAYIDVMKDGASVQTDMRKVKALSFEDKIKLYREEVYATALERLIIPNNYKYSSGRAYHWALRRTITSLTRGWSARFLVENYDTMYKADVDYVARHLDNKSKLIKL